MANKKRVVFISHCLLNQWVRAKGVHNTYKYDNGETAPFVKPLLDLLFEHNVAIEQMPCPEILWEGLERDAAGIDHYSNDEYYKIIEHVVDDVLRLMKEFTKNDVEVIAVIGVDGSPSCGVDFCEGKDKEGSGIFMKRLMEEISKQNLNIPFVGLRLKPESIKENLKKVERLLENITQQ